MIQKKVCSKCNEEKPIDDFHRQKRGYLGRRADCKVCCIIRLNIWNEKNPDYAKNYSIQNKKLKNKLCLKYYYKNKEKISKYQVGYYKKNYEKIKKYGIEYRKNNPEKIKDLGINYYCNNKEKYREYARNRYKNNMDIAALKWMRNFLCRSEKQGFTKNQLRTITELGYSPMQLTQRIECQFKEGMSWDNRKQWHIDHKKPISVFPQNTSMKTIHMLCNLQPIWKKENISKSNKWPLKSK